MAESNVIKTGFDAATIVAEDGTGTPLTHTMRFDNGDFQISGLGEKLKEVTDYERRGEWVGSRYTKRKYPTIQFSAMVADLTVASTSSTFTDFITAKTGTAYAARVSTNTNGDVFHCNLTFTMEGADYGDAADQTISCADCEVTFDFAEGDPNKLTFSAKVKGAITGSLAIPVA